MNVSEILDTIDDMLDKAWSLPLSGGKCVVDVERLRELIGDVRLNLPSEVKQAKMIVADRRQIVDDARSEAEGIVRRAEDRAKAIVDKDELVKQAQIKANEINTQSQVQARELKRATNDFIEKMLMETESSLLGNVQEIKRLRMTIRKPGQNMARPAESEKKEEKE